MQIVSTSAKFKQSLRGSVRAILQGYGAVPHIDFEGQQFRSEDRYLASAVAGWMSRNTDFVWADFYRVFNQTRKPRIVLPDPAQLDIQSQSALTGGAYHEALHVRFSKTTQETSARVMAVLTPARLRFLKGNRGLAAHLPKFVNILEDIRIENLGCRDYNIQPNMMDLQDLILDMEADPATMNAFDQLVYCIRDVGLGYQTSKQAIRCQKYPTDIMDSVQHGVFSPFIQVLQKTPDKVDPIDIVGMAIDLMTLMNAAQNQAAGKQSQKQQEDAKDLISQILGDLLDLLQKGGSGSPSGKSDQDEGDDPKSGQNEDSEAEQGAGKDLEQILDVPLPKISSTPVASTQNAAGDRGQVLSMILQQAFRASTNSQPMEVEAMKHVPASVGDLKANLAVSTASLTGRIRRRFLRDRQTQISHGYRQGYDLSEQRLVEEHLGIQQTGLMDRPFERRVTTSEEGMSAVILMDKSTSTHDGSIASTLLDCSWILTKSLISCGSEVAALTFGSRIALASNFCKSAERIVGMLRAEPIAGGTPMAQAMDPAIEALRAMPTRHKFVFVLTDGAPNDYKAVLDQIQLASRYGIRCVGIGIGSPAAGVKTLFPEHAWSASVAEMPAITGAKVEQLCARRSL